MQQQTLTALLASITGNLITSSIEEEQQLDSLQEQLAQTLQHQDIESARNQKFSFESSDFFFSQNIKGNGLEKIEEKVKMVLENKFTNDLKVFVRDTPIRSSQVAGSVPPWAGGARVLNTIGPFFSRDGRPRWFDFFKVEKLVAVYFEGHTEPAILFKAVFGVKRIIGPILPPEITNQYNLAPGSVWINAKLLSNTAASNRYAGIRVKGGKIILSQMPKLVMNRLSIAPNTNVQVSLTMEQPLPDVTTAIDNNGADARALKMKLPTNWNFSFTATTHNTSALDSMQWTIYGMEGRSDWSGNQQNLFDGTTNRLLIPYKNVASTFTVKQCLSPFQILSGEAGITNTWWGIPTAVIDTNLTVEADGNGAILMLFGKGISCMRKTVQGSDTFLPNPLLIAEPGRIGITDLKSDAMGSTQRINLWKDEINTHGTAVEFTFLKQAIFIYNTLSKGDEVVFTTCDADVQTDRPIKVNGEALSVLTKKSVALFASNAKNKIAMLYDDNIIFDNTNPLSLTGAAPGLKPIALALENALFTTTPVNGCLLVAYCTDDWNKAIFAKLFLTLGLYAYLPTLPDPYAANINLLKRQYEQTTGAVSVPNKSIWLWLVCRISSKPSIDPLAIEKGYDAVKTSFHFGNLPFDDEENAADMAAANKAVVNNTTLRSKVGAQMLNAQNVRAAMFNIPEGESGGEEIKSMMMMSSAVANDVNYEKLWDDKFGNKLTDAFALLDVSSNANQMGISFGMFGKDRMGMMQTASVVGATTDSTVNNAIPFLVQDMSVMAKGMNVRSFTLPLVAWEPVFNLSYQFNPPPPAMDPLLGFNYYPNDGGATKIFNVSNKPVSLAPIPVIHYLVDEFKRNPASFTIAAFTLPFGLRALALLSKNGVETKKPSLDNKKYSFKLDATRILTSGTQLNAKAGNYGKKGDGTPSDHDSPMFPGYILQVNNVLDMDGTAHGRSTLGGSVTKIFNSEFFINPLADPSGVTRGVPVSRIDFTGYGANLFSNWVSPSAVVASTSQARFDVMMGRTGHEVIQVKSILYPFGIRVVRTITLHRESSGYIHRIDSGWIAESDGLFDFRYSYTDIANNPATIQPFVFHPGVVRGLYNIRNIKEDSTIENYKSVNNINAGDKYLNPLGVEQLAAAAFTQAVECQPVWFDADIEIENIVQGKTSIKDKTGVSHDIVGSKKILGYVQLSPPGIPLTNAQFKELLLKQNGSIGGAIDCQVDINKSNQNMRLNRFDVSPSVDKLGNTIFVVAARGNVVLPKDGSWTIVQHNTGSGEITPLQEGLTVPLIREGKWVAGKVIDVVAAKDKLIRMAHPAELLRNVTTGTINFGILQNMGTQKALFLTPSFKNAEQTLLSKTPPLFADAYRMMTGKGIFPNVGDAVTDFGKAISMMSGVDAVGNTVAKAFSTLSGITDNGSEVFKLLKIDVVKQGEAAVEQGMELLKGAVDGAIDKALKFDLPDFDVPLVEMEGLKIYIEYKTSKLDPADPKKDAAGTKEDSKLNFDVASKIGAAATDAAETWKGRLNNLSMVVDLGSFERLMRIKGNFDSKKGKAAGYAGDTDSGGGLPTPEIEFHPALQPIIDLLQVLADLSAGDYGAALKKGLKVAMSNAGEIWEYKFEATKEIPLVRFPPLKEVYDNPATPLKLEASMGLGVYFNAALKVTTDPKQLLPTAGAFLKFHGGLSVMCVSVGVGTIYANGSVDVKIACDTAVGPNLTLKFGFGASITVGLPVVGNATVTFMVGVEMYADSKEISITAFMMFRGHAELLGGLVGVTITIEAKGTVKRIGDRTDCSAQVTFAIDISIFLIIDISFSETWGEERQVA